MMQPCGLSDGQPVCYLRITPVHAIERDEVAVFVARRPRSSTCSTRRSTLALLIPRSRRALPMWVVGLARRLWKADRRRNRKVGQGDEVRGRQSGLIR